MQGNVFLEELKSVSILLESVLIGYLFIQFKTVEETQEAPAPVSTKVRQVIPSILKTTT